MAGPKWVITYDLSDSQMEDIDLAENAMEMLDLNKAEEILNRLLGEDASCVPVLTSSAICTAGTSATTRPPLGSTTGSLPSSPTTHGPGTRGGDTGDTPPTEHPRIPTFMDHQRKGGPMESSALLVMGVGGLGCRWALGAHSRIPNESDLMLVDADAESFRGVSNAHCLHLDATGSERGIAALPSLAAHRAVETLDEIRPVRPTPNSW